MRSQLRLVDLDQVGNVRAGRSVEVFNFGTTTPISNAIYASPTAIVVLNPNTLVTNTLGETELWIDGLSAPVDVRFGGVNGVTVTSYFIPDPSTLALATSNPSAILTNQGDIIVATAPSVAGRLGIGTAFQELVVNAGATALQWASGVLSRATAAGDLFQATGPNAVARLPIGTAFQELIVGNGATATAWASGVLARVTAAGDIVQATGANAIARLPIGTARQNLAVNPGATAVEYVASIQSLIQAAGDLIVGSGANAAARLAKGADGTYLSVVAGVLTWTAGSNVALTTAEADLASDVALNNTTLFFDGTSISLAAGTWLIGASVLVLDTTGIASITAKLWDGTNVESQGQVHTSTGSGAGQIAMFGIVVLGSTTTWKVSCRDAATTTGLIKAAPTVGATGNVASHIRAIKIG